MKPCIVIVLDILYKHAPSGSAQGFLAHLSRRLKGELIVYRSIRRPCVSPLVRASVRKHFQTQISPQPVGQS